MRLKLTFLFCLSSLIASAQFFVTEGTTLSLKSPETLLSSQELHNQIDVQITGKGTLYLHSTSQQQLASSQTLLELPSLFIQKAHLVQIQTALHIQHLEIEDGVLQLNHPVLLPHPEALKLGATAAVANNSKSQLLYYSSQLQPSHPLVLYNSHTLLKFSSPQEFQLPPQTAFLYRTYNYKTIVNNGYSVYFKHATPPPEFHNPIS